MGRRWRRVHMLEESHRRSGHWNLESLIAYCRDFLIPISKAHLMRFASGTVRLLLGNSWGARRPAFAHCGISTRRAGLQLMLPDLETLQLQRERRLRRLENSVVREASIR